MTENNIPPTCERCGTPLQPVWGEEPTRMSCPLDDKDCEIQALRKRMSSLETTLQELETKLRAAEDAVVVLHDALAEAVKDFHGKSVLFSARALNAIDNTSTLAAQRKLEIVREALEQLATASENQPYDAWPLCNVAGDPYNASELREAFSTILHSTEPA